MVKSYLMRSLMIHTLLITKYYSVYQIEKMGGTSTGKITGAYRVWWGNVRERIYLKDAGIDGRILLNWAFEDTTMNCVFRKM
jgi:hypothetical protein